MVVSPRGPASTWWLSSTSSSVSRTIDAVSPRIKERRRGLGTGGLVLSLAETVLSGGDFLVDLDYQRKDAAGVELRAVPDVPASTTVIGLGKRFSAEARQGVEQANAALAAKAFALLPKARRDELSSRRPTIDPDPTDVEVYGAKRRGCAYNYAGQRTYRPHPAVWAEAGWALAAELGSGRSDPRPQAPGLIARAVAALPGGLPRPIVRGDSGFFSKEVARAALANGADFAIAVKRTDPVWRSVRKVPETGWRKALGMEAEVAECGYVPAGWPPGTRTVCRRVKLSPEEVSRDARSRRRRTIDPEQLALFEAGEVVPVYAYSFIITNLSWDICELEAWFRERALVEETTKDSKYGAALRHMPSGYEAVNALWTWSALIAMNISSWLQALTRHKKWPRPRQAAPPRGCLRCRARDPPRRSPYGAPLARRRGRCVRVGLASARHARRCHKPITAWSNARSPRSATSRPASRITRLHDLSRTRLNGVCRFLSRTNVVKHNAPES